MLPNPRYYNPFKRMDKARQRQEQVLFNMQQAKLMSPEEYQAALAAPVTLRDASSQRFDLSLLANGSVRPCHQRVLEEILLSFYGEQALYRQGLKIRTTIDKQLQDSLIASLATGSVPSGDIPDSIIVMKEGAEIRALACSTNVEQARAYPGSLGTPNPSYEVIMVPLEAIRKDEIVAKEPSAANTVSSGAGESDRER